ncbi:MAG: RHS repeat-associated core domain-containing protein [Candidatus Saccharicenans sp.]|nr:RHS repeat-associated core domain-containing protein [Candidatus Saccharicenans sp.]
MRDYIYLGDRLLAEYQPQTGKIYYYTSDQVNSTRVVTDQNGVRVFAAVYDPYGGLQKIWENSYSPAMKFSGKERDTESNLDYFGARCYGNYYYRWLSPDPVVNRDAALSNPQLWNLYAFCHNNPVTYWDPDGMDVFYATEQLRSFFATLAARSQKVRDTLALYEGEGRPNLHIGQGDAEKDIDGDKAYGSFAADIIPDYGENLTKLTPGMTLEEMENLATWSVREATLVLDTSLTISIFDRDTVRHALHELGHADQAARSPLQYRRDLRNIRDKKGNILKHEDRPAEIYADQYKESVYGRIAK